MGQGDPASLATLRGRGHECEVFDRLLVGAREGTSGVLVLRGEAGVGKTALLEYAVDSASDLSVLRTAGVQSEMELPFAALHQLCAPMLDSLEQLPDPQRAALGAVFGLSQGNAPDRFVVGLAALSLLSEAAERRPFLCVVDDAQWLDRASAQTLAFVARRLLAEPAVIVFATREPSDELRELPELEVRGLQDRHARDLLGSSVTGRLDERVTEQILAESRSNPLALLELPRGLSPAQLAGGFGLPGALALSDRIEESFLRRIQRLPAATRSLLLVAAAEPVGDPGLLWAAAERLGIANEALAPARSAGLLEVGIRARFRHPLVRSAVYRVASADERRRVHRVLGEVTDSEADPDRRAWHRAQATSGPDEDVAAELEQSAGRAQARGGLAAAAAFLERSATLTVDPGLRAQRMVAAATANLQAGAFDPALRLLANAEAGALDELQRALLDLLRGQIAFVSGRGSDAAHLLLNAAQRIESLDIGWARQTYLYAYAAALLAGRLATTVNLLDVAQAAKMVPRPSAEPSPHDLLLEAFAAETTDGRAKATPMLQLAASTFASDELPREDALLWGWLAIVPACIVWDEHAAHTIQVRQVQLARDAGALARLAIDLNSLACDLTWGGEFDAAASLIAEVDAVRDATGTQISPYGAVTLAAFRGREAEASELIDATIREAAATGQGTWAQMAQWVAGVLYNGLERYEEALTWAEQASDPPNVYVSAWALPELVEAATRCGKVGVATRAVARLAEATSTAGTDWGLGLEARSRALISEGEVADRLYHEAIDRLGRIRLRPELARAHLLYGEWLRGERQRPEAREQLRMAHKMFVMMGMEAFAQRTERELLATGETARRRTVEAGENLTAQERQIARMARDGFSNAEIGARLFISARTVKYHLQKVFTKLGISSRNELGRALPREPTDAAAA